MSKRLALVIHALHGGGAERLMSQLAARWASAGHQVHLITLAHPSTDQYQVPPTVHRHGLDLMQPSRGLLSALAANWQRVRQLRKLLAELSPDFILSFCDKMNITTVTAAHDLGKPLWIAEHSDPARQRLGLVWETWRQWAYRRLVRKADCGCIALTEPIAAKLKERFPGLKMQVIPPAIGLYYCSDTAVQSSATVVVNSERPYQLLSVGRHSPEKNVEALLQAWSQLVDRFPKWRLVVAGDGPQHQELVDLAHHLQIGGTVHFAGWVSDVSSLYRQSSLLAMTSHYEGVPVVMLEAMAAGVPCVSTPSASSVTEFAQAGAVQLADSTQPADIAKALAEVMANESRRASLSERGRAKAAEYSWDTIGPRWDHLLNNLSQVGTSKVDPAQFNCSNGA